MVIEDLISNSHGQKLVDHLVAVSKVSLAFAKHHSIDEEDMLRDIAIAGFFHDVGKVIKYFQEYIVSQLYPEDDEEASAVENYQPAKGKSKKKSEEYILYPRHHEVSWAVLSSIFNSRKYANALHSIYWHHPQTVDEYNKPYETDSVILGKLTAQDIESNNSHACASRNALRVPMTLLPPPVTIRMRVRVETYSFAFTFLA